MKRTLTVLSIAAALLLAGCSSAVPQGSAASSGPAVTPTPTAVDRTLCNTNCPGDPGYVEPTFVDVTGPALATNKRGNVEAKVSESYDALSMDSAKVGSFTFTDISFGECVDTGGIGAREPVNGQILLVGMTIETVPPAENPSNSALYTTAGGSSTVAVIMDDGTTWNGSVDAPVLCLPDSEAMPGYVNPGEKRVGVMALDVPVGARTLIYRPTADLGYEFELPS